MNWTLIISLALITTLPMVGGSYPPYAEQQSLPRGKMTFSSWWYLYHGVAILLAIATAIGVVGIVGMIATLIGAFLLTPIFLRVFGKVAQIVSLLGLPVIISYSAYLRSIYG